MKTKLSAILLGGMSISAFTAVNAPIQTDPAIVADAETAQVSNIMANNSQTSMMLVNSTTSPAQVKITLNAPATLSVYDQNGKVAFTQNLKSGVTTVDTSNFPLGQDRLVVTTNQLGSSFTMAQTVNVQAAQGNS